MACTLIYFPPLECGITEPKLISSRLNISRLWDNHSFDFITPHGTLSYGPGQRYSLAGLEKLSCHDVRSPLRGPRGKELWAASGSWVAPLIATKKMEMLVCNSNQLNSANNQVSFDEDPKTPKSNDAWRTAGLQPMKTLRRSPQLYPDFSHKKIVINMCIVSCWFCGNLLCVKRKLIQILNVYHMPGITLEDLVHYLI